MTRTVLKAQDSSLWCKTHRSNGKLFSYCFITLFQQTEMQHLSWYERLANTQQGSKLTVASSKFATWKFSLLPGQTVGSKKVLPGIVPRTLSTLCCECLQCKLDVTFHMNHLPSRQFTCNVKPHFCWNKKKILWKCLLNMLSAWRFNP